MELMMNAQTKIKAETAAPFTPRVTLKKPVHCFAVRLAALLRVRPFISSEAIRYYLNGVYVHAAKDGGALCVATDGHRLGVRRDTTGLVIEPHIVTLPKELRTPAKLVGNPWAILTRSGERYGHLSLVEALHDRDHDTAENAFARVDECSQRFGDVIIDGTFPDYTRVMPEETKEDVIRGFNGKYLSSFGSTLTIRGGSQSAPHIILDNADQEFIGVLMPMRTNTEHKQDWAKALSTPTSSAGA